MQPVTASTEDGLLYLFSFHCELWINIWGESSHSANIFKIQKNIIRIITGCRSIDSCRGMFKNLKILCLQSQYVLSIFLFVVHYRNKFTSNSDVRHITTRQNVASNSFHQILSLYQKIIHSVGIELLNNLPRSIKNFSDNPKQLNHP